MCCRDSSEIKQLETTANRNDNKYILNTMKYYTPVNRTHLKIKKCDYYRHNNNKKQAIKIKATNAVKKILITNNGLNCKY